MIDEANEAECAINRVLTTLVNLEVLGKSLVLENSRKLRMENHLGEFFSGNFRVTI